MDLDTLKRMGLPQLEALYVEPGPLELPTGCHRGHLLRWIDSAGARHPLWRPTLTVGFAWTPFGVDFDQQRWWFWHPRLALGRFEPRIGPSRWRETETVSLHYHASRLPAPIRSVLYDEVKPLSPDLCLGIGGINAERGEGEMFFFALQRT